MEKKIIIFKGNGHLPERFWDWAVCTKEEFTKELEEAGWIETETTKYLSRKQLEYLSS